MQSRVIHLSKEGDIVLLYSEDKYFRDFVTKNLGISSVTRASRIIFLKKSQKWEIRYKGKKIGGEYSVRSEAISAEIELLQGILKNKGDTKDI
jgi:hypothetical protein